MIRSLRPQTRCAVDELSRARRGTAGAVFTRGAARRRARVGFLGLSDHNIVRSTAVRAAPCSPARFPAAWALAEALMGESRRYPDHGAEGGLVWIFALRPTRSDIWALARLAERSGSRGSRVMSAGSAALGTPVRMDASRRAATGAFLQATAEARGAASRRGHVGTQTVAHLFGGAARSVRLASARGSLRRTR